MTSLNRLTQALNDRILTFCPCLILTMPIATAAASGGFDFLLP